MGGPAISSGRLLRHSEGCAVEQQVGRDDAKNHVTDGQLKEKSSFFLESVEKC